MPSSLMAAAVQHLPAQHIIRHRRNQGEGEDERSEKRENDGFGKWAEKVAGDTAEREHWHKDDVEHEQRDESRHDDLLGAIQNGRLDLFALLEMIENAFNRDDSLVNQHADRQSKPAERHDVDGLAEPGQGSQREQNGERNGDDDDQRRAPAAEEEQDH